MRKGIRSTLATTNSSAAHLPESFLLLPHSCSLSSSNSCLLSYTLPAGRAICYSWSSICSARFGCSFYFPSCSRLNNPHRVCQRIIGYLVSGYVFKRLGVVDDCYIPEAAAKVAEDCECSRPHAVIFPLLLLPDLGASFNLGSLLFSPYSISDCSSSEQDL